MDRGECRPLSQSHLSSRRVILRSILPTDYSFLYRLATDSAMATRWRLRGQTPSLEMFAQILWQDVTVQFGIALRSSGSDGPLIGMVQLYRVDPWLRIGYVSSLVDTEYSRAGLAAESIVLLVDYSFRAFDLRKLYFESPTHILANYSSAVGSFLQEEGRLKAHDYHDGNYVDLHVLSVTRDTWSISREFVEHVLGRQ